MRGRARNDVQTNVGLRDGRRGLWSCQRLVNLLQFAEQAKQRPSDGQHGNDASKIRNKWSLRTGHL